LLYTGNNISVLTATAILPPHLLVILKSLKSKILFPLTANYVFGTDKSWVGLETYYRASLF
jgi:hypothetical protein